MKTIIRTGDSYDVPINEYYCDTQEEFEQIKNNFPAPIGSKVYILGNQKNDLIIKIKGITGWATYGTGGGGETPSVNHP